MSFITSVAVLVKHLGATLCIIKAGTSNCNFIAVFSAVFACSNGVWVAPARCSLHLVLNIVVSLLYNMPTLYLVVKKGLQSNEATLFSCCVFNLEVKA
mgnify:FL=1